MTGVRTRGEKIRRYIISNVEKHPKDIALVTARKFDITRQAVNKHLKRLVNEKALVQKGNTRNRTYSLHPLEEWVKTYKITPSLEEDVVWRNDVAPTLEQLPDNVFDIWHYGFTEMFNNVIDHSEGDTVALRFQKTATTTEIVISDNGIGIFRKIQDNLGLLDERHAVLELAKGKLPRTQPITPEREYSLHRGCSKISTSCQVAPSLRIDSKMTKTVFLKVKAHPGLGCG